MKHIFCDIREILNSVIIVVYFISFSSVAFGMDYQFKDLPNKVERFDISCEGLMFSENSAFASTLVQISKSWAKTRNIVSPKKKLEEKFEKYGIDGYRGYFSKIKMLLEKGEMSKREGETLSREKDYSIKDIGVNAGRKFVSQQSARDKGAKLISKGEACIDEAEEMKKILKEYIDSRSIGKLTRKWKSANGETVYGSILELNGGIVTLVDKKNNIFKFKETMLDKKDIDFLHKNIVFLDIKDLPDFENNPENADEVLERARNAYENGNAYAGYLLAVAYRNGYGVGKNHDTALKYMEEAAKKGIAEAQKSMGDYVYSNWDKDNILSYVNNDRTKINKALEWYEKSGNGGNRPAMIMCAKILQYINPKKACEWAEKAYGFKYEDEDACEILAVSLLGDIQMRRRNTKEAVKWYEIAAVRKNLYAILQLADYYCSNGNYHKFLTYSSDAFNMNNLNGDINLVEAMYWGWGTNMNIMGVLEQFNTYTRRTNVFSEDAKRSGFTEKYCLYGSLLDAFDYRNINRLSTVDMRKNALETLKTIRGKYAPIAEKAVALIQNGVEDSGEILKYSSAVSGLLFSK